jgi:hypothetical protein
MQSGFRGSTCGRWWRPRSGCLIVHGVGFWDRQVDDLLTGIGELVGGGGLPKTPATPSPAPDPSTLLPAHPAYEPPKPLPEGPWPPYIPEGQMDLSGGMPRSTLDGIHNDDPNYVVWKPAFPGDLPPYWMHDYEPVGPDNPGTWVRGGPEDDVPGETHPAGVSGQTGDAVNAVHDSLKRNEEVITDADQQLGQAFSDAHTAAARTQQRLVDLDAQIRSGVAALQPFIATPAGQQQMAAFLMAKTRDVQAVVSDARRTSRSHAAIVDGLSQRYDTIRNTKSG